MSDGDCVQVKSALAPTKRDGLGKTAGVSPHGSKVEGVADLKEHPVTAGTSCVPGDEEQLLPGIGIILSDDEEYAQFQCRNVVYHDRGSRRTDGSFEGLGIAPTGNTSAEEGEELCGDR